MAAPPVRCPAPPSLADRRRIGAWLRRRRRRRTLAVPAPWPAGLGVCSAARCSGSTTWQRRCRQNNLTSFRGQVSVERSLANEVPGQRVRLEQAQLPDRLPSIPRALLVLYCCAYAIQSPNLPEVPYPLPAAVIAPFAADRNSQPAPVTGLAPPGHLLNCCWWARG